MMCTIYVKCFLLFVIFSNAVLTFNISPNPSVIFTQPKIDSQIPTVRSSYFGYSINLRRNSALIGAPRAQSTLPQQQSVNETGAIYKCDFNGFCQPFSINLEGNEVNDNANVLDDFRKDFQWLGASIDGGEDDLDPLIVCAPRMTSILYPNELISTGKCYKAENTTVENPKTTNNQIFPLTQANEEKSQYKYSQMGMSIHVSDNLKETIFGLPGVDVGKGTIVRHHPKVRNDGSGNAQSKRQVDNGGKPVSYTNDFIQNSITLNNDSYFGYAVSSGYFRGTDELLYVASAPQGNKQQGVVYFFEIIGKNLKEFFKIDSQQMGEYFGYSLVTDDFDADGFPDIAISAPFYSKGGEHYDNGAVYIYKNNNGKTFELYTKLTSDFTGNGGQFGKSMSKIGDINRDGFGDLLIGAPFEDNGAVYVYLGGRMGLSQQPSQKISAPSQINQDTESIISPMFGLGLSKGVDIDENKFPDILIGSPNSEQVFLYKTYPTAKIIATIKPDISDISNANSEFNLNFCWMISTDFALFQTSDIALEIILDNLHGRATFLNQQTSMQINEKIVKSESCQDMKVFVKYNTTDMFNPIFIEMKYNLLNGIPAPDDKFCEHCIVIDPNDPKSVNTKLVFNTGCKNETCFVDLKLESVVKSEFTLPYTIGSTNSLDILYSIKNIGETAFLTKLTVTIPLMLSFMKIPPSCSLNITELVCSLNNNSPLYVDQDTKFELSLDTTKLDGSSVDILAEVTSQGNELNKIDNSNILIIPLREFNNIEISGKSSIESISLQNGLDVVDIFHVFQIRNSGPSPIKASEIIISIPTSLLDPWSLKYTDLINFEDIKVVGRYNGNILDLKDWTKNDETIIKNYDTDDILSTSTSSVLTSGIDISGGQNGMDYDSSKHNYHIEQPDQLGDENNSINTRRRRRHINENHHNISRRSTTSTNYPFLNNIPKHRRYLFECNNQSKDHCINARFSIHNFQPGQDPVLISLNITLDLAKFDKVITNEQDLFVLITSASIIKTNDLDGKTMEILDIPPHTIISKFHEKSTPIWVWILSALGGVLLLVLITYGMYKLGFFNRLKKEEMESLKRDSEPLASLAASSSRDHYD